MFFGLFSPPPTTAGAIKHFTKGVDQLNQVVELRTAEAHTKEELANDLIQDAKAARDDAVHAARIAKRFEDLVS